MARIKANVLIITLFYISVLLTSCGGGSSSAVNENNSVINEPTPMVSLDTVSPSITEIGNGYVTLSWSPVSGASSYNVYYAYGREIVNTSNALKKNTSNTSTTVLGLMNGMICSFLVTAVNGDNESARSQLLRARAKAETYSYLPINIESVDDSALPTGSATRLSLDSKGKAHILYQDGLTHEIRYANNTTGSWSITTINSGTVSYDGAYDIAVDENDSPFICLGRSGLSCKYITGDWVGIDGGGESVFSVEKVSVLIDENNKIHVYYLIDGVAKYATNENGAWIVSPLNYIEGTILSPIDSVFYFETRALDQLGITHKVYANTDSATGLTQHVYAGDTATFNLPNEVGGWYWSDMVVDNNGKVHIVYTSKNAEYLFYSTNSSNYWETFVVDSDANQYFPSISVDGNGKIFISYYSTYYTINPNYRDLKFVSFP